MPEEIKIITGEDVQKKLSTLTFNPREEIKDENPVQSSPYIEAATVMAFYDPGKIKPVGNLPEDEDTRKIMINELIGRSNIVADSTLPESRVAENEGKNIPQYKLLFSVNDAVRKFNLEKLVGENRINEALEANNTETRQSKRPLQYLFTRVISLIPIRPEDLNIEELNALYTIIDWVEGIKGLQVVLKQDIVDRIELLEMLSPFKHLTGSYDNGVFRERFRGRNSELVRLRSYVGVAAPKGIKESVERWITGFFSSEKRPLLVFGLGGIGKSTLISKFILEHIEATRKDRFPFVYLDFDRPNLSALEPQTLLIEAARQISIQYRDVDKISQGFSKFYASWNEEYSKLVEEGSSGKVSLNSVNLSKRNMQRRRRIESAFLKLLAELTSFEGRPLLIVLDTFEEVQYKGSEFVNEVLDFFELLRKKFSKMRIIISGRAPVGSRAYEMELGTLDQEAAEGYLSGIGISDLTIAKNIATKIGGNPLTLKLAAQLVKEYGVKELEEVVTIKKSNLFFSTRLPEIEIQAILYERILEHLHNPEVKKLAHPGLVLRKITPDLILKVLAGPCDLKVRTLPEAQNLFNEIAKEVSLVTQTEPNVLRHRSDVRKVMLKLIMESDKKDLAMEIHRLAVTYYKEKEGIMNRAEEFYHRLALGESPRELDARWIDGMEDYLTGSRDELPERAQAFILGKAGIESIDLSIWDFADTEDQNRHLAKQAANLLNSGLAERALQLLKDVLPTNLVLTLIKVRALRQLDKYHDAAYLSKQALASFYADQMPPHVKAELQQYADDEQIETGTVQGSEQKPMQSGYLPGLEKEGKQDDDLEDQQMTTLNV